MDKLELSEFIDSTIKKKRPRIEESIDDLELSSNSVDFTVKKKKIKVGDYMDEAKNLSNNGISDKYNTKKEKDTIYSENDQNIKSFKELVKNTTEISTSKSKKIGKNTVTKEEDKTITKLCNNDVTIIEEQEDKKNEIKNEHIIKSEITDTEVVDGLELSVECASDKEESSSENEDEEDAKPRPKTVIVKAEPNESELECSLSEEEKYDLLETTDISETKSEKNKTKKRDGRTSFNKIQNSESNNSQNNNFDEDYSSRIKKKIKSLKMRRSTKRVVESRRDENTKSSHKKSTQYSPNKNCNTMSAEKVDKNMKNKIKEAFSEKESSVDKSENNINSEEEGKSTKSKRTRRSNRSNEIKQKENKQIQKLKRYLSITGIRIKHSALLDCKDNATRIKYLKELLEKNGVNGRPTLEKCKQARKENERMQEIFELDVSNIISEERVTRAQRNTDNDRKTISLDTSFRHREARNTFKRIRTVIDSDSE